MNLITLANLQKQGLFDFYFLLFLFTNQFLRNIFIFVIGYEQGEKND